MEEATQLGFPSIQWTTEIDAVYWDTSVYAGLRQFHQGKGFDPESQDVAVHLGEPLYQVSNEAEPPFAHVEDETSGMEDYDGSEQEFPVDDENVQDSTTVELNRELPVHDEETHGGASVEQSQPTVQDLSIADESIEPYSLGAEDYPASQSYQALMIVKFTLVIFLALSSLYECV
ncbi:hypothetical protein C8R44DRAFT_882906 [Mycena epipterygia]|nr:hypothetical protein C8R44DRAFT_882906 [Mycena epipterygia]